MNTVTVTKRPRDHIAHLKNHFQSNNTFILQSKRFWLIIREHKYHLLIVNECLLCLLNFATSSPSIPFAKFGWNWPICSEEEEDDFIKFRQCILVFRYHLLEMGVTLQIIFTQRCLFVKCRWNLSGVLEKNIFKGRQWPPPPLWTRQWFVIFI